MNNFMTLISEWANTKNPPVIHLMNNERIPIGALYLDEIDLSQLTISETKNVQERYYIHVNGLALLFTYYKICEK